MIHHERTYRIGQVARQTGVSVEALRYYERLGLVPHPPRTERGVRRYDAKTIDRVRFIKQSQTLGLKLREIGALIAVEGAQPGSRCRDVRDLLGRHIEEVDRRTRELRALRRKLSEYRERCDQALAREPEPACPTLDVLARQE